MKKILLLLLISSSCFGYRAQMPTYREVNIEDVRDKQAQEENERLRRENERLLRANARQNAVVYVRGNYRDDFQFITNDDVRALKYIAVGILLGWLILR